MLLAVIDSFDIVVLLLVLQKMSTSGFLSLVVRY